MASQGRHLPVPTQPDMHPLHVFRRADGKFIVYDERLPVGRRTVRVFAKAGDAIVCAETIYKREGLKHE